jgi:hypothetical protein
MLREIADVSSVCSHDEDVALTSAATQRMLKTESNHGVFQLAFPRYVPVACLEAVFSKSL